MTITGTRFGTIDFEEADVIEFVDGLIGFPGLRQFVIITHDAASPFRWLQSLDEAGMALLLADPGPLVSEYAPIIAESTAGDLGLGAESAALVFTTANIPLGKPNEMTLNLMAPIIINPHNRQAKQVVLEDAAYTMKHRVFPQDQPVAQAAA